MGRADITAMMFLRVMRVMEGYASHMGRGVHLWGATGVRVVIDRWHNKTVIKSYTHILYGKGGILVILSLL